MCLRKIFDFYAHISRKPDDNLLKVIFSGIVEATDLEEEVLFAGKTKSDCRWR